ncbi:hypothetical protein FHS31_002945 [Sphingomonas vulcanisoli]|uniref:DUF6927 domain-containing protein n=1 Tax=Sphingomonas vulcanisoli TaxID=1658060 RepID=A0ABX0TUY2_9SPHN|nr:hypothetical protein [Sphingomonas vulcanisoli]NIJ09313.1 hypothetical protein [Sphingomonas vulcanisoli]
MGWLFMRDLGRFATPRAYLDDQFTYVRDDHRLTVLASSMVGTTYYAACERIDTDVRMVFAVICLTKRSSGARDGCTFGYKDMSEDMGPHESECPAAILDLLTETQSDYARAWRSRCRDHLEHRRLVNARPTPRPGQIIIFDEALTFSDGQARDRLEVVPNPKGKQALFRDPMSRAICRIPNVKRRGYRLVNPAVRTR